MANDNNMTNDQNYDDNDLNRDTDTGFEDEMDETGF